MATHESFNLDPFWDDEYKLLDYRKEEFNDTTALMHWIGMGHTGPFGGYMCDMRGTQPSWNNRFIDFFERYEHWKNIGTSYYRMEPGSSLPNHVDTYKRYIALHNLQGKESTIRRAVVFLEDWQSGHYAECCGQPYVNWNRGFTLVWDWDAPHMACNMGMTPRYTLQITGHL